MSGEEREVSKGITVMDGRMGGTPCIKGTRIPAQMIADLQDSEDPMALDTILDAYPRLTYADLTNAKLWAARA